LSEYEKKQLREREELATRTREKLIAKKPSNQRGGMAKLLSSAKTSLTKVKSKDKDLKRIKYRSLEEDRGDLYSVSWSQLSKKIEDNQQRNEIIAAIENDCVDSLEDRVGMRPAKNRRTDETTYKELDDSHCNAIFGTGDAQRVEKSQKGEIHSVVENDPMEKILARRGHLRRAGLGAVSSSQAKHELQRQDDVTVRWERERERQWSKNHAKSQDSSFQHKSDSDSDSYVQIKRTDYKQDLRADKLLGCNEQDGEGKKKSLTWRQKRMARLKKIQQNVKPNDS